jgi:hypothetical protein
MLCGSQETNSSLSRAASHIGGERRKHVTVEVENNDFGHDKRQMVILHQARRFLGSYQFHEHLSRPSWSAENWVTSRDLGPTGTDVAMCFRLARVHKPNTARQCAIARGVRSTDRGRQIHS